jgi:hypothetical protein
MLFAAFGSFPWARSAGPGGRPRNPPDAHPVVTATGPPRRYSGTPGRADSRPDSRGHRLRRVAGPRGRQAVLPRRPDPDTHPVGRRLPSEPVPVVRPALGPLSPHILTSARVTARFVLVWACGSEDMSRGRGAPASVATWGLRWLGCMNAGGRVVPRMTENGWMICAACRVQHHEDCPGGNWCDCQHQPSSKPPQPPMAWIRQG